MSIIVSVVIPVFNEEKYIDSCIRSMIKQDFPRELMEWIFVDGCSKDRTKGIVAGFKQNMSNLIRIYDNPNKTQSYAMNIGIRNAIGKYIIRLDAHSEYACDYISKCVHYLETTDDDNVGGIALTKSKGFVGNAIGIMLSSKFGVGNSQFRTSKKSGHVDTVPFGAFRREVFEKYGLYDERLIRCEDMEMNYRIRKNGGKIYMSEDIRFVYYCRDSIKGIAGMAVKNGKWNIITSRLCPGSVSIRHFVPFLFLSSLIFAPILILLIKPLKYLFIAELIMYFLLDLIFSIRSASKVKYAFLVFILFPIFHLSYGFGSLIGLITLRRYK